ncbi:MAG: hypothetical protein AAB403_16505, partial [Planctomycetota bacterium]
DLGAIRFAGMHDCACLLVAGSRESAAEVVGDFWRKVNTPGRAVIVVALSREAQEAARSVLPPGRATVLDHETAAVLLESSDALSVIRDVIRRQVSLRRLIPFDTEHPVEHNMFCGRTKFLNRLLEEEDVSFAIAGPGRIGKTSLMKRYLNLALQRKDSSRASKFYIDLMPCADRTADGLARFLALRIESSRRVSDLTCERLYPFLLYWKAHFGRPVDLLLDETDEFLGLETFRYLGSAARNGLCRVMLGGRGILLSTVLGKNSPLRHGIDLLRLEPLTDREAETLLLRPFEDLGFTIIDRQRVLDHVARLTGKLPHLVQHYGRRLAELLADGASDVVNHPLVVHVRDEFETARLFIDPIFEVKNPKTRLVALSLLGTAGRQLNLPQIQGVVHDHGLALPLDELWQIVNELVVQNVLAWNEGRFHVANESLAYYSHTQGFFSAALREARADLQRATAADEP